MLHNLNGGQLFIQLKYCPMLPSLNKVDDDDDDDDDYYYYYCEIIKKTLFISHNQLKYAQDVAETSDPFIASFCLYMFI